MPCCVEKLLERSGKVNTNRNIKNAESWQLSTVSDFMDGGGDAGQEICIFNIHSNVLMGIIPGTCFDKHCLGS